jgi:hypothetical protein
MIPLSARRSNHVFGFLGTGCLAEREQRVAPLPGGGGFDSDLSTWMFTHGHSRVAMGIYGHSCTDQSLREPHSMF